MRSCNSKNEAFSTHDEHKLASRCLLEGGHADVALCGRIFSRSGSRAVKLCFFEWFFKHLFQEVLAIVTKKSMKFKDLRMELPQNLLKIIKLK